MIMKTSRLISLFTLIVLLASCVKEGELCEQQIQKNLQVMVDSMLTNYKLKYPGYPGGLALKVVSKKGSYFVSTGMGAGITDQIHFRAASNSKTFTSAAILLLAQEGKLNIDARITDTIPGTTMTYFPLDKNYKIPFRNKITIRQLLQHIAGVWDVSNEVIPDTISADVPYKGQNYLDYVLKSEPAHTFTFDELVEVVATCELYYSRPGKAHHYSNTGYSILGKIIERISGKSYSQFVTERIIVPMGLTGSSLPFSGDDQLLPAPYAKGYYYSPDILECTKSNLSANVAEGTLITTPENLVRFLRNLLRGEGVLTSYWINNVMLAAPEIPADAGNYACGIFYAPNLGYGHNGAHEGYLSRMVSDPNSDITIVTFSNAWNITDEKDTIIEQMTFLLDEGCYKAKYIVQ
ncbi:MAG: class A beta-lactamase-related serine hydrolase [Porphyromonadaceae bacterium]|nr:MAG: class A beta-lactamase-related serine hydrolase [Porphyromonadaceae bacterium]